MEKSNKVFEEKVKYRKHKNPHEQNCVPEDKKELDVSNKHPWT
jgi:hypothetical protein